jgi:hypothetical protein
MSHLYESQRGKSFHHPLDLGIFDETSVRYLQGRLGAENKGQAGFRSTNDGTTHAFMNVWFSITITQESYLILIKENQRQKRNYNVSVYQKDLERNQLSYPLKLTENESGNFYNSTVAGYTSDLYNIIDDKSSFKDKNRTSLYPLKPGSYVINISTQRWDMFRYGVYLIIESPFQTGYFELENDPNSIEYFLGQENTSLSEPSFFLMEDTVAGKLDPVRDLREHSERTLRSAWSQYNTKKPFPDELVAYLRASTPLSMQ